MNITNSVLSSTNALNGKDSKTKTEEMSLDLKKAESLQQPDTSQQSMTVVKISSQAMSGNSAPAQEDSSKYVTAALNAKREQRTLANRQNAVLNSAMVEASNAGSSSERTLAGKRAARRMMLEKQQTIGETAEKTLKTNKNIDNNQQAEASETSSETPTLEAATLEASSTATPAPEVASADSAPAASPQPSVDVVV